MLHAEIQRGKEPMQQALYCKAMGATAACMRRLCEATAYSGVKLHSRSTAKASGKPESFLGDSWFTGVKVAEWAAEQDHAYFGALKTSTKYTPFQELIDKMQDYPSGAYLVMECTTPKGHKLICVGYKYSASKVLVFLGTKNSGFTKPGEPYIARFPDANGNVAQRNVLRPDVISNYFNDSNVIDSHNQARQYELALEKRWIVENGYFRVDTTLLGMTVTDCWRAYKHAMPDKKKHKELPIKEFADRMAYDCIYNAYSDTASLNGYLATAEDDDGVPLIAGGRQSDVSNITEPTINASVGVEHQWKKTPELECPVDKAPRPIRRICFAQGCTVKTHWLCSNRQCERYRYSTSRGIKYGVFYCPQHQYMHHENILNGTGV
jgi:hypothetical protein